MKVMLGNMELRLTEQPDTIQMGGGSMLAVKEFPGGNVSIQNFGPLYDDISWEGWFEGTDAKDRMYTIGNMRQKGEPIIFSTDTLSNKVVIEEFKCNMKTDFRIPFSIKLRRIIVFNAPNDPNENLDSITDLVLNEKKEDAKNNSEQTEYVVQAGDSLYKIALKVYGNANEWGKIYQKNSDIIDSSNYTIYPGQKLVIEK